MRARTNQGGGYVAGIMTALLCLCIGLMACGGGGGGGGDTNGVGGVPYAGLITPAAIDDSNAQEIAASAAMTTGGMNTGIVARKSGQQPSTVGAPVLGQLVLGILGREVTARTAGRGEAHVPVSDSVPGACGGSTLASGSVDDQTGDFSLALDFNSYCDGGFTMDGQVDASGRVSSLFSMNISMTGSSLAIRDNSELRTYLWEDFVFTFRTSGSTMEYTVDGRFYHPGHGYVFVTTPSTLKTVEPNMYPSSGSIRIVEDQVSPDSAMLTAVSSSQYRVDVDYGNNGTIDETVTHTWGSSGGDDSSGDDSAGDDGGGDSGTGTSDVLVGSWGVISIESIPASVGGPSGVDTTNSTWVFTEDGNHQWFFFFDRGGFFFDVAASGGYSLNGTTLFAQGMSNSVTSSDTIALTFTNNNQTLSFVDDEGDRWTYVKLP